VDLHAAATRTFAERIEQNPYPGRGLALGRAATGDAWLAVYWIMGRSDNSRNRRFVAGRHAPHGARRPAKRPLARDLRGDAQRRGLAVTNGDQTRVVDALGRAELRRSARKRERGPTAALHAAHHRAADAAPALRSRSAPTKRIRRARAHLPTGAAASPASAQPHDHAATAILLLPQRSALAPLRAAEPAVLAGARRRNRVALAVKASTRGRASILVETGSP
jgi:hypothetical protein